jgi:predicted permease
VTFFSGFHKTFFKLRSLLFKRRLEQELDEEIEYHLERQAQELIDKGWSADEARYAALRAFHGVSQRKEECREARGLQRIEDFSQDVRHGLRSLKKNPGFTLVAVATLALGIGANTTMFTLLDPILFRPFPYPDPGRLVRVYRTSPQSESWPHSASNFLAYRADNAAFGNLAAFTWTSFNLSEPGGASERIQGLRTTFDFFPVLGVQPAIGRVYSAAEDRPAAEPVIVLSYRFWTGRFGADPGIVGRTLRINGREARVIGVMPESFENPLFFGRTDAWSPIAFTDDQRRDRGTNYLNIVGRLKPDASIGEAESQISALAERLRKENVEDDRREGVRLDDFKSSMQQGAMRQVSWFTFGMTVFVLLIACANLANLQLARTIQRAREFALRSALGGGRRRLIKQSLTESILISLIGCAVALPCAVIGVQLAAQRLLSDVPGARFSLDYRFFAFAFGCSLIAGIGFGAVPALLASRSNLNDLLRDAPRQASGSKRHNRLRQMLVVAEVSFALILLAGAGYFIGGLKQVVAADPGWRVEGLLIGRVGLDSPDYARPARQVEYFNTLQERLAALPGVQRVAVSQSAPTWLYNSSSNITLESPEAPTIVVNSESVSPTYFSTLEIPLKEGRAFTDDDRFNRQPVAIINETLARRFWPNESAVGKRFVFAGDTENRKHEIVGVVGDVHFPSALVKPDSEFTMYRPMRQSALRGARIVLRTSTAPETLIPAVRQAAAELDGDQPVFDLRPAREHLSDNISGLDLAGTLLRAFSVLGLAIAAVGIFGVVSYSVTQRTREIGVRIALGAESRGVRHLVLKQGLALTLTGAAIGSLGALAATQLLSNAIPGLPVGGGLTLPATILLLLTVASLACYLPAYRASKVDPIVALRQE